MRINAHSTRSSSEERVNGVDHLENDENREPFNEDLKSGDINKTVKFKLHETLV